MDKYIKFLVCVLLTLLSIILAWSIFGPFICLFLVI